MNNFLLMLIVIFIICILQGLFFIKIKGVNQRSLIEITCYSLIIIGVSITSVISLSAFDKINWFSNNQEWPLGNVKGALKLKSGVYVVPHRTSGRVQFYNEKLEFLRGWNVKNNGRGFYLSYLNELEFLVYLIFENKKVRYDLNGNIVSTDNYSIDEFYDVGENNDVIKIPTPIYLIPFTHILKSFFFFALGMIILILYNKYQRITGSDLTFDTKQRGPMGSE